MGFSIVGVLVMQRESYLDDVRRFFNKMLNCFDSFCTSNYVARNDSNRLLKKFRFLVIEYRFESLKLPSVVTLTLNPFDRPSMSNSSANSVNHALLIRTEESLQSQICWKFGIRLFPIESWLF